MTSVFAYLLLGMGNGAVYAALGLALVMTYKSSGVVNFATGAVALYAAYTFAYLRHGELLVPIPGLKSTIDVGGPWSVLPALVVAVGLAAVVGVIVEFVVFRPMRTAPVLAKAVASIGVMLVLQALIALQVGSDAPSVAPIFEQSTVQIGDAVVPTDRLWLAAVIIALAVCAGLVLRYTRFGIATEASAESEKGALLTGLSPGKISVANWALSSATAGIGGVVIAPIVPSIRSPTRCSSCPRWPRHWSATSRASASPSPPAWRSACCSRSRHTCSPCGMPCPTRGWPKPFR